VTNLTGYTGNMVFLDTFSPGLALKYRGILRSKIAKLLILLHMVFLSTFSPGLALK